VGEGPSLSPDQPAKKRIGLWGLVLRLILAHIAGLFASFAVLVILVNLMFATTDFGDRVVDLLLPFAIAAIGFAGGAASGRALYDTVRDRRGRFFLLVLASPATFIWALLVFLILIEYEPSGDELLAAFLFCVAAGAGSLAGHRLGGWQRTRRQQREEEGRWNEESFEYPDQYHVEEMKKEKSEAPGEEAGDSSE